MTVQHGDPDWGTIGGALAAIATAIGGTVAAWNQWGKQKTETKRDSDALTLDGVFRLVNELQAEVVRKAAEILAVDQRCNDRIARLEARIVTYERTIEQQVEIIAALQSENRQLRQGKDS